MRDFRYMAIVAAAALGLALAGCGGGGSSSPTTSAEEAEPNPAAERAAINSAIAAASTAVNAVDNDSSDAEVSAAEMAITSARGAIADADNVPDEEKAANSGTVNALATQLSGAVSARQMAIDAEAMEKRLAQSANAKKLSENLPSGSTGNSWSGQLYEQNDNDVPVSATGQFDTQYWTNGVASGRIVGAFGAAKQ